MEGQVSAIFYEGLIFSGITLQIDWNIPALSQVETTMNQAPLMFIGGLNISHHDNLVRRHLNKNSFWDGDRICVKFRL